MAAGQADQAMANHARRYQVIGPTPRRDSASVNGPPSFSEATSSLTGRIPCHLAFKVGGVFTGTARVIACRPVGQENRIGRSR